MVEISFSHRSRARTFAPSPALSSALSDPASAISKLTPADYKILLESEKWTRSETELVVKLASDFYPLPIDWSSVSKFLPKFTAADCRHRYESSCAAIASRAESIHEDLKVTPKKPLKRNPKKKMPIWLPADFASWSERRQSAWQRIVSDPNAYYMEFAKPGILLSEGEWSENEISTFRTLLVERPPEGQWGLFSMFFPHRTGKQCLKLFESLMPRKDNARKAKRSESVCKNRKKMRLLRRCGSTSVTDTSDLRIHSPQPDQAILESVSLIKGEAEVLSALEESKADIVNTILGTSESHERKIEGSPVVVASPELTGSPNEDLTVEADLTPEPGEIPMLAETQAEELFPKKRTECPRDEPLPASQELGLHFAFLDENAPENNDAAEVTVEDEKSILKEEQKDHAIVMIDENSKCALLFETSIVTTEDSDIFIDSNEGISDQTQADALTEPALAVCEDMPRFASTKGGAENVVFRVVSDEISVLSSNPADSNSKFLTSSSARTKLSFSERALYQALDRLRKQFHRESENLQIGFRNSSERLKVVYRDRIARTEDPESHLILLADFAKEAASMLTMMNVQAECLSKIQSNIAKRYIAAGLIEVQKTPVPDMKL